MDTLHYQFIFVIFIAYQLLQYFSPDDDLRSKLVENNKK